ncbi:hypothetical protein ACWF99_11795 [Nocardia sp. NPDC055002]
MLVKRFAALAIAVSAFGAASTGLAIAVPETPTQPAISHTAAAEPVVLQTGSAVIDLLAYIAAGCIGSWSPAPPAHCV